MRWASAIAMMLCAGCAGTPADDRPSMSLGISQAARDRIALCGAGISGSMSAELELRVMQSIEERGALTAEIARAVEAAFFAGADPNDEDVRHAFASYVACIQQPI